MLIHEDPEQDLVVLPAEFDPEPGTPFELERAILRTVAYADVFDYPLTAEEIHRYLIGVRAARPEVEACLDGGGLSAGRLSRRDEYYTLPGREQLAALRRERGAVAARLWPKAVRYGRAIARLPYVRMAAVTGALAVDNVAAGADLDYLVVTAPGRLWCCRAMVILLVRWAALHGDTICPNYFLSEAALVYRGPGLYAAHEMAQMVPLAGMGVYRRMIRLNPWVGDYLPNVVLPPRWLAQPDELNLRSRSRGAAETLLGTSLGDRLESWEMARKIEKFNRLEGASSEAGFCADWCKGHFDGHERRTMAAYAARLRQHEAGR